MSCAPHADCRSVLFLIDQLTELGGAERMMLVLAQSLKERGYRVTVATLRDGLSEEAYGLADEILVLPTRSCLSLGALSSLRRLRRVIREREVCLVQTYFESADLLGIVAARLAGVRAICSSRRDMGILRSKKHFRLYRLLTPFYSHVFAVSEKVALWHQRVDGIAKDRISVVHNGVALERYAGRGETTAVRTRFGLAPSAPLVTTIANVNPWKGLDIFIEAAALVKKQIPTATFAIAGDWTDEGHLKELQTRTRALGLSESVHFLGRVEDVPALLLASDVFALLSRSEGFPNAVIEAMAAGLPVVATRVGGTQEAMVNGRTGYLVANEDYQAAAGHIISLLRNEAQRKRMGNEARQFVADHFSIQNMVLGHTEVYDALLAT